MSPAAFRTSLQLRDQTATDRTPPTRDTSDTVSLSAEALARLAGGRTQRPPDLSLSTAVAAPPEVAAGLKAYAKAAG